MRVKVEEAPVIMTIGTTDGGTDIQGPVTLPVGRNAIKIELPVDTAISLWINISGGWLSKIRLETIINDL
jgi:hypothetical protein